MNARPAPELPNLPKRYAAMPTKRLAPQQNDCERPRR